MKLFSTSSLLIPITLEIITIAVVIKTKFLLFCETFEKKEVIFEPSSFFTDIFLLGAKFKRVGNKVKVITNEVINPNVIKQPKSIIGLIPLNIRDKKSNIVVSTV